MKVGDRSIDIALKHHAIGSMGSSNTNPNKLHISWHEPSYMATAALPSVEAAKAKAMALNNKIL